MKTQKRSAAVLVLAVAAAPGTILADDVHCPPNIGNTTVDGNVLIAAACRLDGTYVKGNVHIYAGGSLIARNMRIEGSVQTERAAFVDIQGSEVNGNIQLDDMVGAASRVVASRVGGSIQMKGNRSRLEVLDNRVGQDIQAFSNSGGVIIEQNVVNGNLQCKSNTPPPAGGGNQVGGNKEDQCANLQPEGVVPSAASNAPAAAAAAAGSSGEGGGGSFGFLTLLLGAFGLANRRARLFLHSFRQQ